MVSEQMTPRERVRAQVEFDLLELIVEFFEPVPEDKLMDFAGRVLTLMDLVSLGDRGFLDADAQPGGKFSNAS